MKIGRYETLSDLWHRTCKGMLLAKRDRLDGNAGLTTVTYDNFLMADSMDFELDLGHDLWLTRSRFTKLQRDYLERDLYEAFLDRSKQIYSKQSKRGVVTQMFCRNHGKTVHGSYQWGNCMMAFTFHGGLRQPPTLGLHSRVCYISYIGGFDLALSWVIAREIGERCNFEPEDMRFRWYIDAIQFQSMKAIPYFHAFDCVDRYLDNERIDHKDRPTLRIARSCLRRLRRQHEAGLPIAASKHGPMKRLRQRYQDYIERGVTKPSVPLETLNLDALRERRNDG